jgi:putative restriction endonuclease
MEKAAAPKWILAEHVVARYHDGGFVNVVSASQQACQEAMAFGVLVHRLDSVYDDSPAEQYQFPGQYLRRVQDCVGDWIVYYEPTKVIDTRGYFAIARIQRVIPDPAAPGMYLALIEPGSYLDFVNPVPFRIPAGLVEQGLLNERGDISGRAQSAVRALSPEDFVHIVRMGFEEHAPLLPRVDESSLPPGFQEDPSTFIFDQQRERASFTVSRIVRDRIFRRVVLRAYRERCAVTGLRLINGAGRAEVAAAHIRPVEADGPDIVSNGIALCGTAHWMFDRGLISLSDDLQILISRQANDVDAIRTLINASGRADAPSRRSERPHPHFLQWHREHCFKQ